MSPLTFTLCTLCNQLIIYSAHLDILIVRAEMPVWVLHIAGLLTTTRQISFLFLWSIVIEEILRIALELQKIWGFFLRVLLICYVDIVIIHLLMYYICRSPSRALIPPSRTRTLKVGAFFCETVRCSNSQSFDTLFLWPVLIFFLFFWVSPPFAPHN